MSKKRTTRRATYKNSANATSFLRRPVVQLGILGVVALVIVMIVLFSQGQSPTIAADISIDDAYNLYQKGDSFFLDVRRQDEWDQYHAANSTLIPLDQLPNRLNELPKNKQIVVICHSGNRSKQGRDILLNAGFTNVTSVTGGLVAWQDKGYPLVTP